MGGSLEGRQAAAHGPAEPLISHLPNTVPRCNQTHKGRPTTDVTDDGRCPRGLEPGCPQPESPGPRPRL